ncbi:MAG: hypothetical protein EB127_27140 [Alphaproteobacteria bacterium]|nr:hypothetical protein [Alphaproteobacteria bacterium]
MTTLEYQTLLVPINLLYSLSEFTEIVKVRELGWKQGMLNLLKVCEVKELYEYCAIIKKELDKEGQETL